MAQSHQIQESHGSLGSYIAGFILAAVLTAGSFFIVTSGSFSRETALTLIAVLAVVQIIVHVVFFLHLSPSSGGGWNLLAFCYTLLAVIFLIFGTLWVMHNVGMYMMSR